MSFPGLNKFSGIGNIGRDCVIDGTNKDGKGFYYCNVCIPNGTSKDGKTDYNNWFGLFVNRESLLKVRPYLIKGTKIYFECYISSQDNLIVTGVEKTKYSKTYAFIVSRIDILSKRLDSSIDVSKSSVYVNKSAIDVSKSSIYIPNAVLPKKDDSDRLPF